MIRNWVGYECKPSSKQLRMACMLLLEVARRCPESRKKSTTLQKFFPLMDIDCGRQRSGGRGVGSMRTDADKGEGGQKLAKSCGHLLCMTPYGSFYLELEHCSELLNRITASMITAIQ